MITLLSFLNTLAVNKVLFDESELIRRILTYYCVVWSTYVAYFRYVLAPTKSSSDSDITHITQPYYKW